MSNVLDVICAACTHDLRNITVYCSIGCFKERKIATSSFSALLCQYFQHRLIQRPREDEIISSPTIECSALVWRVPFSISPGSTWMAIEHLHFFDVTYRQRVIPTHRVTAHISINILQPLKNSKDSSRKHKLCVCFSGTHIHISIIHK